MSEVTVPPGATGAGGLRHLAAMPAWLTAAADGAVVAAELRAAVPELASGSRSITACSPKLRLKDGPGWSASYRVTVDGGGDGETETLQLVGTFEPSGPRNGAGLTSAPPSSSSGAFGADGWRCKIPSLGLELALGGPDVGLPTLPRLTDPAAAGSLLEAAMQAAYPGTQVVGCRPEVMRYKPGSRCTLRYELELATTPAGPPTTVVAKTYRGDKGANAFAGMQALWDADVASGEVVSLAEPIAYLPDLRLLVQGPVQEEQTLKDLVRTTFVVDEVTPAALAVVAAELDKAADGLAALHASGVDHGETVRWEDELADVRDLIDRLRPSLPTVAASTASFLDRLEVRSAESIAEPLAPCHRSFRPAQVLLHQGRIAFIDFDGLAMAEPALDVALFRAAVRDVGAGVLFAEERDEERIQRGLDHLDDLCDAFVARYSIHRALSAERVLLWETLDLVTYALHCWTKIKPDRLATRMALLDRHVSRAALA